VSMEAPKPIVPLALKKGTRNTALAESSLGASYFLCVHRHRERGIAEPSLPESAPRHETATPAGHRRHAHHR